MTHACTFCEVALPEIEPENVALLAHLRDAPHCQEQFVFMVENLHATWTVSTSGP